MRRLRPYFFGLAAVATMAVARTALQPVLGNELPFLTLFPPVFFAAWLGGLSPALLATAATVVVALYVPIYSLALSGVAPAGVTLFTRSTPYSLTWPCRSWAAGSWLSG